MSKLFDNPTPPPGDTNVADESYGEIIRRDPKTGKEIGRERLRPDRQEGEIPKDPRPENLPIGTSGHISEYFLSDPHEMVWAAPANFPVAGDQTLPPSISVGFKYKVVAGAYGNEQRTIFEVKSGDGSLSGLAERLAAAGMDIDKARALMLPFQRGGEFRTVNGAKEFVNQKLEAIAQAVNDVLELEKTRSTLAEPKRAIAGGQAPDGGPKGLAGKEQGREDETMPQEFNEKYGSFADIVWKATQGLQKGRLIMPEVMPKGGIFNRQERRAADELKRIRAEFYKQYS